MICRADTNYVDQSAGSGDCQNAYVLIDDIFVGPICDNECVNQLPALSYGYSTNTWHHNEIQNSMVDFDGATDFKLYVSNAMIFIFDLWNSWGQHFYHFSSFDVNGLKNPPFNDFLFEWLGFMNNGYYYPDDEVFVMRVQMYNCISSVDITKTLTCFANGTPTIPPQWTPNIANPDILPCCPANATIDNFVYNNDDEIMVQDFIHSGNSGQVDVASGVNVMYHAGNEILLGPYFQVNGNFEAEIVPCGFKPYPLKSRMGDIDSLISNNSVKLEDNGIYTLNPQPVQ